MGTAGGAFSSDSGGPCPPHGKWLPPPACPSLLLAGDPSIQSPLFSPFTPVYSLGYRQTSVHSALRGWGPCPGPVGKGQSLRNRPSAPVNLAPHTTPSLLWGRAENRMEDLELPPPKLSPVFPQHAPHKRGWPPLPFALPSPCCLLPSPLALA